MSQIIAGDFEQRSEAEAAVKSLRAAGVKKCRLCVFGLANPTPAPDKIAGILRQSGARQVEPPKA